MTSKPRWGFKRSAMVLRPWIVPLLVNGDLKQRAQKVHVLQNVRCPARSDGSVVKELTDGTSYIKAIFTAEALMDYNDKCLDDSNPPCINDALLILNDYDMEFLPHELCNHCEFAVVVKRFTVWAYQEGFGLKHSPVNSMANENVKKKIVVFWKQWRENQAKGACLDTSMNSMPLSQLLEEMGMESDSFEMEEEKGPEEDTGGQADLEELLENLEEPSQTSCSDRNRNLLSAELCIEDFIISESEEKILEAIPEWQSTFVPEPTPNSESEKSSGPVSPIQTLREDSSFGKKSTEQRKTTSSHQDRISAGNDGGVVNVDEGIQVSQSLWENFLREEGYTRADNCNAEKQGTSGTEQSPLRSQTRRSSPRNKQESPTQINTTAAVPSGRNYKAMEIQVHVAPIRKEVSPPGDVSITPVGSRSQGRHSSADQISPSLLSPPELDSTSKKSPRKKHVSFDHELLMIDDSLELGEGTVGRVNKAGDLFEAERCVTNRSTDHRQNDNRGIVVIDITSSQEVSPAASEHIGHRQISRSPCKGIRSIQLASKGSISPSKEYTLPTGDSLCLSKSSMSPTKGPLSSSKGPTSPTGGPISSSKNCTSPTKGRLSLSKGPTSPTKSPLFSTKGSKSQTKGPLSSSKDFTSPTKGPLSSSKDSTSPTKGPLSSSKGSASPPKSPIPLSKDSTSPTRGPLSLSKSSASPTKGPISSSNGSTSSTKGPTSSSKMMTRSAGKGVIFTDDDEEEDRLSRLLETSRPQERSKANTSKGSVCTSPTKTSTCTSLTMASMLPEPTGIYRIYREDWEKEALDEESEEERLSRIQKLRAYRFSKQQNQEQRKLEESRESASSDSSTSQKGNVTDCLKPHRTENGQNGKRRLSLSDSTSPSRKVFVLGKDNSENFSAEKVIRYIGGSPVAQTSNFKKSDNTPSNVSRQDTVTDSTNMTAGRHSGKSEKVLRVILTKLPEIESMLISQSNLRKGSSNGEVSKQKDDTDAKEMDSSVLLSGQTELGSNSFLNDAQIISSGEYVIESSGSSGDKNKTDTVLPASLSHQNTIFKDRPEDSLLKTPINSLPSYQPQRATTEESPSHSGQPTEAGDLSKSALVSPLRSLPSASQTLTQKSAVGDTVCPRRSEESIWGELDSPPLSEEGRLLLELSFPGDLMEKISNCLKRK